MDKQPRKQLKARIIEIKNELPKNRRNCVISYLKTFPVWDLQLLKNFQNRPGSAFLL